MQPQACGWRLDTRYPLFLFMGQVGGGEYQACMWSTKHACMGSHDTKPRTYGCSTVLLALASELFLHVHLSGDNSRDLCYLLTVFGT